jgi:ribosomal protein S18 acetylase RimI-like enzyme
MKVVKNIKEIFKKTNKIREEGIILSNFFFTKKRILELIKKKKLFKIIDKFNLILLKKNKNYYNLYFFCNNYLKLSVSLKNLKIKNYVCDLIVFNKNYKNLYKSFLNNKFKPYRNLIRLVRVKKIYKEYLNTDVHYANNKDSKNIFLILKKNFDMYSDQIPALKDIQNSIKNHEIIIIKKRKILIALLIFENIKNLLKINYWFVKKEYQNMGFGSKLMKFFLTKYSKTKRVVLWVDKNNLKAINKYHHFEFKKDKIIDQIFLRTKI